MKVNFLCGSILISGVCPFPRSDVCEWMELSILVSRTSKSRSFLIFVSSLHKTCTIQVPKFKSLFERVAVGAEKLSFPFSYVINLYSLHSMVEKNTTKSLMLGCEYILHELVLSSSAVILSGVSTFSPLQG